MKRLSLAILLIALLPSATLAEPPLVGFGENSATVGKSKLLGPNAPKVQVAETKDSLIIQAPDPWSTILQFLELPSIPLTNVKPGDSLALTVKGVAGGNAPVVRVQIVSPGNWQQWAAWDFDLSDLKPDEYTTIKAQSVFEKPADKLGEELPADLGSLQIFTKGKSPGPWELEIQSLGVAPAK
jgi:hypothetical protein